MKNEYKEIVKEDLSSLAEIEDLVLETKGFCVNCSTPFELGALKYYEHSGGKLVRGNEKPVWISFYCKNCQYESSLWKIERRLKISIP